MAPSEIIIDPEGDLWISTQRLTHSEKQKGGKSQVADGVNATDEKDAESDKINIKVSSKILMSASPVFKMILTGWGKEAVEFAAKKASSKCYTLDLPEDDTDAAALLFEILHHKQTARSDQPSSSCLEQLAFISDKYQCFGALRYCGAIWIRDWLPDQPQCFNVCFYNVSLQPFLEGKDSNFYLDNLKRLLAFAYVVDLPKEFSALAWLLFIQNKGPLSVTAKGDGISLVDHPLFQHDVAGHIDLRRTELAKLYHAGLMAPISHNWETSGAYCFGASKAVAAYLKFLSVSRVLPHDLEFSGHTFYKLFNLEYPVFKMEKCSKYCKGCVQDHSVSMASDLAGVLKAAVSKIKQVERAFICLDCIKSDGKTREDGKCRMDH